MNSKDPFALDTFNTKRDLTPTFKALRLVGINETYIIVLEYIYTGAIARVHMDNQVWEEIPILRGVRQGDPTSPKLFTATFQVVFRNAQLEEKMNKYRWRKTARPQFCCQSPNIRRCERYETSVQHRKRRKLKDWSQDT